MDDLLKLFWRYGWIPAIIGLFIAYLLGYVEAPSFGPAPPTPAP